MPDVRVAPQEIKLAGIAPSYTGSLTTSDTYKVTNDGRTFLHFKKTGLGACTVTLQTPRTVDGLAVEEKTVTVPASTGDVLVGPFDTDNFNDGSGDLAFTLSEVTGLTVGAFRLPVA